MTIAARHARQDRNGNRHEHHQQKDLSPTEAVWRRMWSAIRCRATGKATSAIEHYESAIEHYDIAVLIAELKGRVCLLDCRWKAETALYLRDVATLSEPSILVHNAGGRMAYGAGGRVNWSNWIHSTRSKEKATA